MTVKRQCSVCGDEFVAKRADAKFCGAKCRQKNFQNLLRGTAPFQPRPASRRRPIRVLIVGWWRRWRRDGGRSASCTRSTGRRPWGWLSTCAATRLGCERASLMKSLNEVMARVLHAADDDVEDEVDRIKGPRVRAKRAEASAEFDAVSRNGRHR